MGLQDQALKIVRNECHHYKEQGRNLDKCLFLYLNIIYQRPIKYSMKHLHRLIKWESKLKTTFDLLVFRHGF